MKAYQEIVEFIAAGPSPNPRVARIEQLWEITSREDYPNGVVARRRQDDSTPSGLKSPWQETQGSSSLATPGWVTQSLWDSRKIMPAGHHSVRNLGLRTSSFGFLSDFGFRISDFNCHAPI